MYLQGRHRADRVVRQRSVRHALGHTAHDSSRPAGPQTASLRRRIRQTHSSNAATAMRPRPTRLSTESFSVNLHSLFPPTCSSLTSAFSETGIFLRYLRLLISLSTKQVWRAATPRRSSIYFKKTTLFEPHRARRRVRPLTWLALGFFCHPDRLRSSFEHS